MIGEDENSQSIQYQSTDRKIVGADSSQMSMISAPSKERFKLINKSNQTLVLARDQQTSDDTRTTQKGNKVDNNEAGDYQDTFAKAKDVNNITFQKEGSDEMSDYIQFDGIDIKLPLSSQVQKSNEQFSID